MRQDNVSLGRQRAKLSLSVRFRKANGIAQILFLLPAFVLFTAFVVYPAGTSIYYSFTDWTGIGKEFNFVGFDNYKTLILKDM